MGDMVNGIHGPSVTTFASDIVRRVQENGSLDLFGADVRMPLSHGFHNFSVNIWTNVNSLSTMNFVRESVEQIFPHYPMEAMNFSLTIIQEPVDFYMEGPDNWVSIPTLSSMLYVRPLPARTADEIMNERRREGRFGDGRDIGASNNSSNPGQNDDPLPPPAMGPLFGPIPGAVNVYNSTDRSPGPGRPIGPRRGRPMMIVQQDLDNFHRAQGLDPYFEP